MRLLPAFCIMSLRVFARSKPKPLSGGGAAKASLNRALSCWQKTRRGGDLTMARMKLG